MDVERANKWWMKAMTKESVRFSHHPTAPKGHRFEVKTADSSRMPTDGRRREKVMP